MKIQCDVCEKQEASVFCAADEAALCEECDYRIHHANKLASKHLRSSLLHPSFKDAPLCDICQEKRAFLFCREDRAILCRECDISIHKTNEHTQNHNRFLLTGVKISASTSTYHPTSSPHSSCSSEPNLKNSSNNTTTKSSVNTSYNNYDHDHDYDDMFNQYTTTTTTTTTPSSMNYDQLNEDGTISTSNTISEYLMEALPGWRLEDLLDSSSANFSKSSEYRNNEVNTNQQQVEENMVGYYGSENEWGLHRHQQQGPFVPSHLPSNFYQRLS